MSSVDTQTLKALGANSKVDLSAFSGPHPNVLEAFPNPFADPKLNACGAEGEILISCPEFTSLCLHGDTMVDVACNETEHPEGIKVKDLVGTEGVVFSYDTTTLKPVARRYHSARMTQSQADCVRVRYFLYKGPNTINPRKKEYKEIVCTPEHPFLVRTGWGKYTWVRADSLTEDMQLVADQRTRDSLRGRPRHQLLAENTLGRLLEEGELVHHIDHQHFNNDPDNLEVTNSPDHFSHHQTERYGYHKTLDVELLVQAYNEGTSIGDLALEHGCDYSTIETRLQGRVIFRTQREQLLLRTRTPALEGIMAECRDLYERGYLIDELAEFYSVHNTTVSQWIKKSGGMLREANTSRHARKELDLPPLNHRVVSVEPAGKHDVYCITVEDTECFFANGVVVHNCPMTGQPDFATIVIKYVPDQLCVESKSIKLYLMSYRNVGEFHESCIVRICNDLVSLLNPLYLVVKGEFTPRGGIPFWPEAVFVREDQVD